MPVAWASGVGMRKRGWNSKIDPIDVGIIPTSIPSGDRVEGAQNPKKNPFKRGGGGVDLAIKAWSTGIDAEPMMPIVIKHVKKGHF
jgi:hypothetical protein